MIRVEVYGRPGCILCDEAKELLRRLQQDLSFELAEVDITLDPARERQYGTQIPVVFVDGHKAFKVRFTEKAARRRIERALAEGSAGRGLDPRRWSRVRVGLAVAALLALLGTAGFKAWDLFLGGTSAEEDAFDIVRLSRPAPAPEFRLETRDGRPFSLGEVKGQVVFVNFWATWCPPCRDEMPSMLRLGRELERRHPGRFKMVAVSVDEGWDPIQQFFGGSPPVGIVVGLDRDQLATRAYYCAARGACPGSYKFPETYIVDRTGRLVAYVVGPRDWSEPAARRFLERLIGG